MADGDRLTHDDCLPASAREANDRKNLLAVNLSLAANALLAVLRTGVGILGHSPALLADGINSTSDAVYLAIVRVFMRLAPNHPTASTPSATANWRRLPAW